MSAEISKMATARRTLRQLTHTAVFDHCREVWLVESDLPMAVTLGLWRPRIFVSTRLLQALAPELVDAVIEQAVETLELSTLAKHAYTLAQAFNSFYHRYRVAQEEDASIRRARTAIVRLYHDGMVDLLDLLGIEVPTRM